MNGLPHLGPQLDALSADGLLRRLRATPLPGGRIGLDGRTLLNFSSNDYLDLARNSRVAAAACRAVEQFGAGAGASRLMSGHLPLHAELERALAGTVGREDALVFGSGFLANLGVLTALAGRGDTVFEDRLNHASLIDGARLSGARLVRYRHADANNLHERLGRASRGRRIVVTDSLFSMDGDIAPLADIADAARRHDAALVVDEAHAIGVFGPGGSGLCRAERPAVQPDVVIGTLSKALGSYGGFAAGSGELKRFLVNKARSFVYSTALPPACAAAAIEATAILREQPALGERLRARADRLRDALTHAGLRTGPSCSQIIPVLVGDNAKALALADALRGQDILAVAVRPPTVPAGSARLRLSVTLAHDESDLDRAGEAIVRTARSAGIL